MYSWTGSYLVVIVNIEVIVIIKFFNLRSRSNNEQHFNRFKACFFIDVVLIYFYGFLNATECWPLFHFYFSHFIFHNELKVLGSPNFCLDKQMISEVRVG